MGGFMRLFSFVLICLLSGTAAAKTYNAQDVTLKNQLFYDKDGQKITGEIIKYYPGGKKYAHFTVVDGQSTMSELYFPNGKIKNQETKDKRIEYWPNNHVRRESHGDRETGNDVRKFYTGAGELLLEVPFKDNQIDGTVKIYGDNARLEEERPYARVLTRMVKTDKGNVPVTLSALHGTSKLYGVDKKVIATTTYDKGAVKKITHFDAQNTPLPTVVNNDIKVLDDKTCLTQEGAFSGALIVNTVEPQPQFLEIPCQDGVIDGTVRVYLGTYGAYGRVFDNIPYKKGKKDGVARVYSYSDLMLSGEVPYKNDMVDGMVREYFETGELLYETPYKDNQIDGVRKVYGSTFNNPIGDVLLGEFPYTKGQQNGVATIYSVLGDVEKKITYLFGKEVFTKEYGSESKEKTPSKDGDSQKANKTPPVKPNTQDAPRKDAEATNADKKPLNNVHTPAASKPAAPIGKADKADEKLVTGVTADKTPVNKPNTQNVSQ